MELPKRTGRPMHPLWAHFHRGEKRNRYHYHAYCSYCVARHGADQVPPTRGVSTDMLRHLESCPNCPRKVVETVRELCHGRDRVPHLKKSTNGGNGTGNTATVDEDEDQVLLLDAVAVSSATTTIQETQTSADDAAAVTAAAAGTEDAPVTGKRTASEALADETSHLTHVDTSGHADKTKSGPNAIETARFLTMPTKRGRTDSNNATEEDPMQTSLRAMSGEDDARIPLPTRDHWFTFVASLTKVLHYSDAITALCQEGGESSLPLPLRELVLGNNGRLWKTLRELAVLLAPLREAYSLVFQSRPNLDEINSEYDNADECATTVHGGLTLAHVMYQLGRMSQQYAALAESADMTSSSTNSGDMTVVARRLHDVLDTMWQRYDLPTMVLAYVLDFHMDTERLDTSNRALQWKSVASYFQLYFQRWFCQTPEDQRNPTLFSPIPSNKVESILNAYQLRQFPFDADTTDCYTDVSSFYSFIYAA
ncbi:hypothetical protein JG687_00003255 [Phytophthora cactorum]|uniref:BED-type domain-containing protein n=1 Tax=Phytophthora cactorum TaxID=29920 RepID=A0A8T1UW62_9STRA|nr:hypothetical protein JG687_00003255 [Phytophthora cactorum]